MTTETRTLVKIAITILTATLLISLPLQAGATTPSSLGADTVTVVQTPAIKINDRIPDLTVDAYHNGNITKLNLTDYKGKWTVFVFYPADFTFVCPTELKELAKYQSNFTDLGAQVFSVSRDTSYVHKAWHDSDPGLQAIRYPMIADTTGQMCRAFGTLNETDGLSYRATFIFDPDGKLKSIEMNDNSFGRSTKELLRKLEAAKFVRENEGKVCPASWEPGEEAIQPG